MSILESCRRVAKGWLQGAVEWMKRMVDHTSPEEEQQAALIIAHLKSRGLYEDGLRVGVDQRRYTATLSGKARDHDTRNRIFDAVWDMPGINTVIDKMDLVPSLAGREFSFHIIAPGDSLHKIAEKYYGDRAQYTVILAANQALLDSPDILYPGQTLRIPPLP